MLLAPPASFTVTDNYATNQYGEIGLAAGDTAAAAAHRRRDARTGRPGRGRTADNAARGGHARRRLEHQLPARGGATRTSRCPSCRRGNPVRVGFPGRDLPPAGGPRLPQQHLEAPAAPTRSPTRQASSRRRSATPAPSPAPGVGGDLKLATFNVLNYFTDHRRRTSRRRHLHVLQRPRRQPGHRQRLQRRRPARRRGRGRTCSASRPRSSRRSTPSAPTSCPWRRSRTPPSIGKDRDAALSAPGRRAHTRPPARTRLGVRRPRRPPEDLPAPARGRHPHRVHLQAGTRWSRSARRRSSPAPQPSPTRASRWPRRSSPRAARSAQPFVVIVNHFKSKGSGPTRTRRRPTARAPPTPPGSRRRKRWWTFADSAGRAAAPSKVFLTGDFNSYTKEDPIQVLYDAGYTDLGVQATGEYTLHLRRHGRLARPRVRQRRARAKVTGADVWNINSVSRSPTSTAAYNYNATDFYAPDPFRASDHDPIIVGLDMEKDRGNKALVPRRTNRPSPPGRACFVPGKGGVSAPGPRCQRRRCPPGRRRPASVVGSVQDGTGYPVGILQRPAAGLPRCSGFGGNGRSPLHRRQLQADDIQVFHRLSVPIQRTVRRLRDVQAGTGHGCPVGPDHQLGPDQSVLEHPAQQRRPVMRHPVGRHHRLHQVGGAVFGAVDPGRGDPEAAGVRIHLVDRLGARNWTMPARARAANCSIR